MTELIKKPFKETAIGKFITDKAPHLIGAIEGFVPAPIRGGLDLVKHLIENDSTLTSEQKAEGIKLANEHEFDLIKEKNAFDLAQQKADNDNTANARDMNTKIQGDKPSWWAKNTIYLLVMLVSSIWAFLTVYILGHMLKLIGTNDKVDYVQVLAIYSAVNVLMAQVMNFFLGSTQNGRTMQKAMMDKIPG